jgi:hypothetical protein
MAEVEAKVIDSTHLELAESTLLRPGEKVKVSIHDLGKSNDQDIQETELANNPTKQNRNKNRDIPLIISMLTTLVAIAGFVSLQMWNFIDKDTGLLIDKKERQREDLLRLTRFPFDEDISISEVQYRLQELSALSMDFPETNETVSRIIVSAVKYDFDFSKTREVEFDIVAIDLWPGYREILMKENSEKLPEDNLQIISKYIKRIKDLRNEDPDYYARLTYDPSNEFEIDRNYDLSLFIGFASLLKGLILHLNILGDCDFIESAVLDLGVSFNNPALFREMICSHIEKDVCERLKSKEICSDMGG